MVKPGDRVQVLGTLYYNDRFGILEDETNDESLWDYVVNLEPCEGKFGKVSKIGVLATQVKLAPSLSTDVVSPENRAEFIEAMAEEIYNSQTGTEGKFETFYYKDGWINLVTKSFDKVWPGTSN